MTKQTYGRWTVIRETVRRIGDRHTRRYALCSCSCGSARRWIALYALKSGKSQSCGCYRTERTVERSTRHGHNRRGARTGTYRTWVAMLGRCHDESNEKYPLYGARGIKVCPRWRRSFAAFLADMGKRPRGRTLDRIDSDGNYGRTNCRWATHKEQAANRRARGTA